jgi:proteasome lid subunit RPN8/RPN11
MDTLDVIKDIDPKNIPEKKPNKFWKILTTFVTIIITIMLLIYLLSADSVIEIITGVMTSEKIDEELTLNYKDYTIIFEEDTLQQLQELYLINEQHEIKACLTGEENNKEYRITGIQVPEIFSQSVFHVSSAGCPQQTLISLHSHPIKHCIFSEQDINTYKQSPGIMIGLMCELDRFTFYKE